MRDVPWGWLVRYMARHVSCFRGMIYGSFRKPRELVWTGCLLVLMGEAFFSSYLRAGDLDWGARATRWTYSSVPDLALLIRGDFVVRDATLNQLFAFHVIALPLVLLGLVAAHLLALHDVGSDDPDGIEIKAKKDASGKPLDGIPFHPYYTVHDVIWACVSYLLFLFSAIFLFTFAEVVVASWSYNNFIPADPLKTRPSIARYGASRRTTRCCAPPPTRWSTCSRC